MTLEFYPLRFSFVARDELYFPRGKAANVLRGGFGLKFREIACRPDCPGARACPAADTCPYARIFEPAASSAGPSGLHDWPRPFVFRAAHLDGSRISPGAPFHFDVNLFEVRRPSIEFFAAAFAQLAQDGLGPGRGRAEARFDLAPTLQVLSLDPGPAAARLRVEFVTPTELKAGDQKVDRPEFSVLFARIRDRISTLRALYGAGPLAIDFTAMGERAQAIRLTGADLRTEEVSRRSSRTGQVHSLGGFTGWAQYEGDLTEFIPYIEAARWTGVGRQCVWGKGEIYAQAS